MNRIEPQTLLGRLLHADVLRFGEFTLKSGRASPYFFNLGALSAGGDLALLGAAYAQCIRAAELAPDVLFGPAYKGIPLASAAAIALSDELPHVALAYNRKEAKTHGEGGNLVGADVAGRRVVLVDDVLTAGTALREALALVNAAGGHVVGVVIALDRQERAPDAASPHSAVQALQQEMPGVPVLSLLNLQDVMAFLGEAGAHHNIPAEVGPRLRRYQAEYCVEDS